MYFGEVVLVDLLGPAHRNHTLLLAEGLDFELVLELDDVFVFGGAGGSACESVREAAVDVVEILLLLLGRHEE